LKDRAALAAQHAPERHDRGCVFIENLDGMGLDAYRERPAMERCASGRVLIALLAGNQPLNWPDFSAHTLTFMERLESSR